MGRHYIVLTDRSGIILNPTVDCYSQLICQFGYQLSAYWKEFFVSRELHLPGKLTLFRPTAGFRIIAAIARVAMITAGFDGEEGGKT